jgi:hypothetical protein
MTKQQVDHILRAASRILEAAGKGGTRKFVIIGSQSLHGKYPDFPDAIVRSIELDLFEIDDDEAAQLLEVIGRDSQFHETYGFYADPVGKKTAVLPKGWKGRLVNLAPGDTGGAKGLCLEPHDLAIAKYAANRDKDREFLAGMVAHRMLDKERLLELLAATSVDDQKREAIRSAVDRDFARPTQPDLNKRSRR